MKFWEAVKAMEEGQAVRCKRWAKDDQWGFSFLTLGQQPWDDCAYRVFRMMQEEWELYEEPVRLLSFMEVVKGLKEGKTYRRKEWPNPNYSIKHFDIGIMIASGSSAWYAYAQDFEATDWIEVKEDGKIPVKR